ncbi:hypothetical protein [Absidia glauca]|uniref:Uncharacterized protein n=1 Tax=Absidia glauca TaxID=4829 RepID=A0A168P667_ABSGL|nr:hypothetical protein [Absidia glauca]
MPYKNGLEPKDARTFDTYDNNNDFDDDDDLDDWTTKPRPRRTGTQALVDFLNTTSPEEFQKTAPAKKSPYKILTTNSAKRITSTSFFLRRRNKSKSSSSSTSASIPSSTSSTHSDASSMTSFYQKLAPNTIHRKNHIEILAHNSGTGASATKLSLNEPARYGSSLHGASARHAPAKSPYLNHTTGIPGPTDPSNNADPIFGDTLPITLPIPSATALSPRSAKTQTSSASKNDTHHHEHGSHNESETNQTNTTATIGVDVIEAGLIQRLKQWQLAEPDKSIYNVDQYTDAPTSDPPSHPTGRQPERFITKRARHAQIQTLPWDTPPPPTTDLTPPLKPGPPTISIDPAIDDLRRQINQERQKRHHLESAIQQTCAHFDILSELAYKKLTELWDEKVRWENACLELNEDLLKAEQGVIPTTGPLTDDFQTTALA